MEILGMAMPVALALLGFVFLCVETVVGDGTLFISGSALMITGFVGLLLPNDPTPLGLAFTLGVSLVLMYICYQGIVKYLGIDQEDGQSMTSSSDSLEGLTGYVIDPVNAREGTVKLANAGMNPIYQARTDGPEIEEEEDIIVLEGGGGNVVTVARLDDDEME